MKKSDSLCILFCLITSILFGSIAVCGEGTAPVDSSEVVEKIVIGELTTDGTQDSAVLILQTQSAGEQEEGLEHTGETTGMTITAHAVIDYATQTVTIRGKIPPAQGQKVLVLVLRPPYTIADAGGMDETELSNAVEYMNVMTSGADVSYTFQYSLHSDSVIEKQEYTASVGSTGAEQGGPATTSYQYFGQSSIVSVMTEIKNASAATIGEMLAKTHLIAGSIYLNDVLQLDLTDYFALYETNAVHEAIAGKDFTAGGIHAIREALEEAIAAQKKADEDNKEVHEAVIAIKNATTETMRQILETHGPVLHLDLKNQYGYALLLNKKDNGIDAVDALYRALIGLSAADTIQSVFQQQVAIQAVNAAMWQEMGNVISHNTILNLNLTGDFKNLSIDDKAVVYKALAGHDDFRTIKEIQDAFGNQVSELVKPNNIGPGSSGGGGGGNRGGSVSSETSIQVGALPTPPAPQDQSLFNDIDDVAWARESIETLAAKGIIEGVAEKTFAPNDTITREQFVKMLVIAFGLVDESAVADFSDVSEEQWYYLYIASAQKYGVSNGIDGHHFGIGQEISRQEMAVMAYRTAKYAGIDFPKRSEAANFDDAQSISEYASESVQVMQQANIIQGVGGNRFAPHESTTRAMAAKVVHELLKLRQ